VHELNKDLNEPVNYNALGLSLFNKLIMLPDAAIFPVITNLLYKLTNLVPEPNVSLFYLALK
jgi:hypothetical protein